MVALHYAWVPITAEPTLRARPSVIGVVVHRIEVSQEDPSYADTPREVARFFCEHPVGRQATGGAMPYPILVAADGTVTQCVPLGHVTPHAVSHNPSTIGVGCIGDFRHRAPCAAQRTALVSVCAALLHSIGADSRALHGHDELAGGSRDPAKVCPGPLLPLDALRRDVAAALQGQPDAYDFVW